MHKGMKDLEKSLLRVDGIVEIHDARIPHSGRNPEIYKRLVGGSRPHLLILNKCDLADPNYLSKSIEYIQLAQPNTQVIQTSLMSIELKQLTNIFGRLCQEIVASPRYTRDSIPEYNIIICGIPNVGKSTFRMFISNLKRKSMFIFDFSCLVNKLRNLFANKQSCEQVGANPGVTKVMSEKVKISHRPKV